VYILFDPDRHSCLTEGTQNIYVVFLPNVTAQTICVEDI
jgi:hypothetical protein